MIFQIVFTYFSYRAAIIAKFALKFEAMTEAEILLFLKNKIYRNHKIVFLINPINFWEFIFLGYFFEIFLFLGFGLLLAIIVKIRCQNNPRSKFFNRGEYEPVFNYSLLGNPQYAWILVTVDADEVVSSETFYTNTGDWFKRTYENGVLVKNEGSMISSYIMIACCLPGGLMITGFNILNVFQFLFNIDRELLISFFEFSRQLFGISMWATTISLFTIDLLRSCRIKIP